MSDEDAQRHQTVQLRSRTVIQQFIRFGIDMEIDQSKCRCVHNVAGKSSAFRVALCLCCITVHIIVGMIGLSGCAIDKNIPRFVLARSSLFILDISYVLGYAILSDPSKRLLFLPEIRYTGSLVLAIGGAFCIYPHYYAVQHIDNTLLTYCNIICYWFAFGAVTADLVFYSLLNMMCCCSLFTSLHISFRSRTNEPNLNV